MYPWEAIARMVKAQKVEFTFGVGDSHLQLYAAVTEGVQPVNIRYEGSAPFMAMAYSRVSGRPGVCSASTGPGVANLVPGTLEAFSACTPLVILCPSVNQKTEGMGEFQECDQLGMMRPITKWAVRVQDVERLPWYIHRAFLLAMNGQPGPVYVEIPYDVGGDITHGINVDIPEPSYHPASRHRTAGDPDAVQSAAALLLQSRRPVAIAGNGAMLSGAAQAFLDMVETLGIPFLTTPGGRGIISERHPLALGLTGLYRNVLAKEYIEDADLVVTVGSRNEAFQTHRWQDFPAGAAYVQIDVSASEIGRNWVPDVAVVGDGRLVLEAIVRDIRDRAEQRGHSPEARLEELEACKARLFDDVEHECSVDEQPIPAKRYVHEVSRVFGDNTILVNENGSQDAWSYVYPFYVVGGDSMCVPVAEQTCMGMGVVGAIAARLARPDKNVVCITGDGAFQMYMKELPTAVQYGAGCTWVVLNNKAFGWPMYYQQETVGWTTTSYDIQTDFAALARACGCHGRRIQSAADIQPALEEALSYNRQGIPVVIDCPTGLDMSHLARSA